MVDPRILGFASSNSHEFLVSSHSYKIQVRICPEKACLYFLHIRPHSNISAGCSGLRLASSHTNTDPPITSRAGGEKKENRNGNTHGLR